MKVQSFLGGCSFEGEISFTSNKKNYLGGGNEIWEDLTRLENVKNESYFCLLA